MLTLDKYLHVAELINVTSTSTPAQGQRPGSYQP